VCEAPISTQNNTFTTPADINGRFLVGDRIEFECPVTAVKVVSVCSDTGSTLGRWNLTKGIRNEDCFACKFMIYRIL